MIGKIEDVFTRRANFSADIAHEIRTPITNLVTQTEIALSQDRTQKELEDVLYSSLEEYNRMTKMVSDMLFPHRRTIISLYLTGSGLTSEQKS